MKKKAPVIVILAVILIVGTAWFFFFRPKEDPSSIRVSGNIEVTDVQMGFKIAGRVDSCFVDEGDRVAKGSKLAQLENEDQKILVDLAQARLNRSRSLLSEMEAGSRPEEIQLSSARVLQVRQTLLELTRGSRPQEIESSQADLETALAAQKSAQSQLTLAKAEAERFTRLYKEKIISVQDFENIQTKYDIAQNQLNQAQSQVNVARQALSLRKEGPRAEQIEKARAALAQAQAEYALVKAGPRMEKIQQASAAVDEAVQSLKQANQQLLYTTLIAPMDGVVLSRSAEPGEFLNPSTPVVTIGDIRHPWLRAYITEKDLGKIHLGDKASVSTDAFAEKTYEGKVSYISSQAEFTPKSVQTFEERVKLMFRIKIDLSNPDGELKPGMPADAAIHIQVK